MIIFNLEQPFLQKEVEEKVNIEKQNISGYYSKLLKWGIAFLVIGVAAIWFFGLNFDKKSDPYHLKVITFCVWELVTIFLIFVPLMFKSRILALIESPYIQASLDKLHDCKAFLSMPGMEKYKEYAESVRNQGRELTYFECDEIIKYWKNLANK
jgi:hypothetical protein